jgi:hypothetical protein
VLRGKRQHCELSGSLEGHVERALVRGARASLAARLDLAALGQEAPQPGEVLVINVFDLVDAELANLAAGREFSAARAEFAWAASSGYRGPS